MTDYCKSSEMPWHRDEGGGKKREPGELKCRLIPAEIDIPGHKADIHHLGRPQDSFGRIGARLRQNSGFSPQLLQALSAATIPFVIFVANRILGIKILVILLGRIKY